MFNTIPVQSANRLRAKHLVFTLIGIVIAYTLYHNESYLLDPADPRWEHYNSLGWWLLLHGIAGGCALVLAPMQYSDRLRKRFTKLHRITGRIYVGSVFVLGPFGAYVQYLDEAIGGSRTFTYLTVMEAVTIAITTGFGLYFAMNRNIPQHRQWMTRSFAVSFVAIMVRAVMGITGWDNPFDWALTEGVVWFCFAFSLLFADLANQLYDWPRPMRIRPIETAATCAVGAQTVHAAQ